MRYRRRFFIPMAYRGCPLGHLIWKNAAMQAWTAEGELVGTYPTRHEAASALWGATATRRRQIEETLKQLGLTEWETPARSA